MGSTFNEFTRCLPSSRVRTRCAWRSTSRCFITPKRVRWGNDSTISVVVVPGRSRRKSRIPRLVGSDNAFHTGSRSSAGLAANFITLFAVLLNSVEDVIPAAGNTFTVLGIDHADGAVPQRDSAASRSRLDFHFHMIRRQV